MRKKKSYVIVAFFAATMLFTMSCGIVNTLLGATKSSGTVSQLWSDVPSLSGAQKADLQLPLAARLAIKAASQGKMDFIAYTTDMSPTDVANFYTVDRMKQAGWDTSNGTSCTSDTGGSDNVGAFCLFGKTDGGKKLALAIVIAKDSDTNKTDVFYARIDASDATPSQ